MTSTLPPSNLQARHRGLYSLLATSFFRYFSPRSHNHQQFRETLADFLIRDIACVHHGDKAAVEAELKAIIERWNDELAPLCTHAAKYCSKPTGQS
jgi:hypothetical protein